MARIAPASGRGKRRGAKSASSAMRSRRRFSTRRSPQRREDSPAKPLFRAIVTVKEMKRSA
jgi:hypothetical protein